MTTLQDWSIAELWLLNDQNAFRASNLRRAIGNITAGKSLTRPKSRQKNFSNRHWHSVCVWTDNFQRKEEPNGAHFANHFDPVDRRGGPRVAL
jgi:hypothetical protein